MDPNQTPAPQPTAPIEPVIPTPIVEPAQPITQPAQPTSAYNQPIEPASAPGVSPEPAVSPFFAAADPVAVEQAASVASGFGSGVSSVASDPTPTNTPATKKPVNKKLIIIIAAIVAVIIIAVVATILFLPNVANKVSGGVIGSSTSAASLVTYEGTGYTISLPANFKTAPVGSTPTSSTINKFTKDGAEATDKTATISVIVSPFSATNTREQSSSFFSALKGQAPADTEFSKDNKSEVTKVDGFEALKSSGTALKDGAEVGKGTGMYVLGNKNMYIISISVPVGADNSIDAEAIINSFKTKE